MRRTQVHGFVCEGYVAQGGPNIVDITSYGGWLPYVAAKKADAGEPARGALQCPVPSAAYVCALPQLEE
jgi:hypothetical protein